jgi:DNA-binding transcriptional MerR regulator
MKNKYTIKAVSMTCGVKPQTLRVWESRYSAFNPLRSENGRRLYSDMDVKKASLLAKLIKKGQSISTIANLDVPKLEQILANSTFEIEPKLDAKLSSLYRAIDELEIEKFASELHRLQSSMGVREFLLDCILPILRDIGVFVVQGKYTITQEHVISTLIRSQLSQISSTNNASQATEIVFATPEGNRHDLSIYIADILTKYYGLKTFNLGAAHPSQSLAHALNIMQKPYLVLGVLSTDIWNYEKAMDEYLKALDLHLKFEVDVILGGGYEIELSHFKNIKNVLFMNDFDKYDKWLRRF